MAKISPKDQLKNIKHTLAALLLLASCTCFGQSASTPNSPTALSVIGTPDDPDIARSIFPDAQPEDLFVAAAPDDAVRVGVRGHESTIQVTSDTTNVRGSFSINGVPLVLADKAPTGLCTKPAFILSGDGLTFCDTASQLYVTK
jgi:hypothetical protein